MRCVPLVLLLGLLGLVELVDAYLPDVDLTNSVYVPGGPDYGAGGGGGGGGGVIIPGDVDDVDGEPSDGSDADDVYRNKITFRRRNVNNYNNNGQRVPFSRMGYKQGYGRFTGASPRNGMYERRPPFTNAGYGPGPYGGSEEVYTPYSSRSPFRSGLMGGANKKGFFGSATAMRSKNYKNKIPYDYSPDYPTNELVFSSPPPTFRELATYGTRFGPTYMRERFDGGYGVGGYPAAYPSGALSRGPGGPDYNYNVATNQWGNGAKNSKVANDAAAALIDSYNNDEYKKQKAKKSKS